MQINAARFAMVGEAIARFAAGITVEEAFSISGLRQECESVLLVKRVSDFLRHFEAFLVEEKVAGCARVDHTRGFEVASWARRS